MANTFVISRANLIYGVCLPLAVLIGYLLADPQESGTVAVMLLVLGVLGIPAMMRWRHLLLLFSCNCAISFLFLPGRPAFWMILTVINLFFCLLNRSIGREIHFFRARSVSYALIFLALVVIFTARFSGGIGFSTYGSAQAGGRKYFELVMGIALYFVVSSLEINRERAGWYVALFFLSTLAGLAVYLPAIAGPIFYPLVELFPVAYAMEEVNGGSSVVGAGITRLGGLAAPALGLLCFLLARYGLRGVLDLARPWRLLLFALALAGALYSGFRSQIILFILIFLILFYLEGLFRTRYFIALLVGGVLAVALLLPNAQRLPPVVQRALSFLPLNIDPLVQENAQGSTDWRLEMWKELLPTIPRYLLKGKGYAVDANDMYLLQQSSAHGTATTYETAMQVGDYHSGPLSVIIPFGIFGAIGFLWFLTAAGMALYRNYAHGAPDLRQINCFLFGYFLVRVFDFIFVFGSLYSDAALFGALVGLGVSLNGGVAALPQAEPAESASAAAELLAEENE